MHSLQANSTVHFFVVKIAQALGFVSVSSTSRMTQFAIQSVLMDDLLVSKIDACACMLICSTATGECALRDSGKSFTIVRPGQLVNEAAGQHKLITGQLCLTTCSTDTRQNCCWEAAAMLSAVSASIEHGSIMFVCCSHKFVACMEPPFFNLGCCAFATVETLTNNGSLGHGNDQLLTAASGHGACIFATVAFTTCACLVAYYRMDGI